LLVEDGSTAGAVAIVVVSAVPFFLYEQLSALGLVTKNCHARGNVAVMKPELPLAKAMVFVAVKVNANEALFAAVSRVTAVTATFDT
jgi:hypothetical protein